MAWYDIQQKQNEPELNSADSKKDYVQRIKFNEIVAKRTNNLFDLIGKELIENIQYRMVTYKAFNAIIIIDYLQKIYEIEEIYMSVYRMNFPAVNMFKNFIINDSIKCNMIISSFFKENKKYERWANELIEFANQSDSVKIAFAVNHSKVFCAKTKCGKKIVFEGSGNFSDNARIEQYLIEINEQSFNFHKEWITDVLNEKS